MRPQKPCDGTFSGADRWPTGAGAWSRHHQPRVNLSFHLSSVRPRRITGIACCRAINLDAGAADAGAAAPPASSNIGARSPNDPPRSKAASAGPLGSRLHAVRPIWPGVARSARTTNPLQHRQRRSIEKPSPPLRTIARQLGKLPQAMRKTVSFDNGTEFAEHHRLHQPSASKPSSAIPIAPGKRAASKTPSAAYDVHCRARPTSTPSPQPPSSGYVQRLNNTPRKCLDFKTPAEAFSKLNQPLHFKRDSTSPPSRGRR